MKASLSVFRLAFYLLVVAFSLLGQLCPPAYAKTRPPVEAGDPDIGNNKPLGDPRVASTSPSYGRALVARTSLSKQATGWLDIYLQMIRSLTWR